MSFMTKLVGILVVALGLCIFYIDYLDKSTKMLEIVEMAERNDKTFSEIHPRLYETNEYADKGGKP